MCPRVASVSRRDRVGFGRAGKTGPVPAVMVRARCQPHVRFSLPLSDPYFRPWDEPENSDSVFILVKGHTHGNGQ
jgi:hypothetical protein